MRAPLAFAAAAALLLSAAAPLPAEAGCKRMAFLVNDYGKDGPTKDAKSLLDKHITEWAAQQNIKDYSVGTKSVSCYQFLNFIVFDEHTCTASANVCWGADKKAGDASAAPATGTPPTPVRKTAAVDATTHKTHKHKGTDPAAHTDAATLAPAQDAAPAEADTAAAAPAAEAAPAAAEAAPVAEPAAPAAPLETGATAPSVETGALGPAGPDAAAPATSHASSRVQASEAASAAAAAAERAAAAAEAAANAAKEAAAAAVAASAAGRGSFVPPLGEAKSAHNLGDAR
jgi:hypothetical protein